MVNDHFNAPLVNVQLSRRTVVRGALAGAGALALSRLLAACAPAGGPVGAAPTAGEPTVAPAGTSTGSVSQILISGGDASTPKGKAMLALREAWLDANPDAALELENLAFDQVITASLTRARAGELADLVQLYPGTLHDAAFPVLRPFSRSMLPDLDGSLSLWDYTTLEPGGSQIGVPIGNQGGAWYYNKRLFERAGLEADRTPETWGELEEIVRALKSAGIIPLAMSRGYTGFYLSASITVQFLPDVDDIDAFRRGEISIEDDRFRVPLTAVSRMAKDEWFHPSFLDKEDDSATGDFAQGNTAMFPTTITTWADFERILPAEDVGVFLPPPHPEAEGKAAYVTPDTMFCLNADAANPDAALSWVNYLGSKEAQETALRIGGQMPNRGDVDVEAIAGSATARTIQDWIDTEKTNEIPFDFFNGTASGTFYSRLPTALVQGEIDDLLAQLQAEQSAD
ncbi:ABC transporter substrate-binding protein [Microbacterium tumbae]